MKKTVDARGMACPKPVLEAKKALKEMTEGTLEVLVDNHIAVQNLSKLASYSNIPVSSEKLEDGNFKVIFRVKESQGVKENQSDSGSREDDSLQDEPSCTPDSRRRGCVVVISSDRMGEGNDELGHVLIKSFIYALTQLDELPETILLYNGGAVLSTEGSESLEDLKLLEAQGVEIMTCGTCLNYYGLSEKLQVGTVTNMYSIVEKMTGASVIVRP